jgi:hypothetical protein
MQNQPRAENEWLVSTNFACARHIRAGMRDNPKIKTLHLASLLRKAIHAAIQ